MFDIHVCIYDGFCSIADKNIKSRNAGIYLIRIKPVSKLSELLNICKRKEKERKEKRKKGKNVYFISR